jgi:RNA polymerase sigma-70 factor (family 1)
VKAEDRILINELRKKNRNVFEALFYEYYPTLKVFATGFVFDQHRSEDIVQEFFTYIWENSENLTISSSVKSYFFRSVRNRCINYLRDIKVKDKHELLYIESLYAIKEDDPTEQPEILNKITTAIEQLPKQMAEIFRLKFVEGKKVLEIASEKDISENTVKKQLQRAKDKIRNNIRTNDFLFLGFNLSITLYWLLRVLSDQIPA